MGALGAATKRLNPFIICGVGAAVFFLGGASGCPVGPGFPNPGVPNFGNYNNTTDPTNDGATYIGSKACSACHPGYAETFANHGHGYALSEPQGVAPVYPTDGTRAGVPNPPDGYQWSDISYVIGGYTKAAQFIDMDGFFLTTGQTGKQTQWLLDLPPTGVTAQFADFLPAASAPTPFDYSCFKCHTTGPVAQDADNPGSQGGRPGILGTWQETGVHCEACHGPGSKHIPNPPARLMFVDLTGAQSCGRCHGKPDDADSGDILCREEFIDHNQQWVELRASGGHSSFNCGYCHESHGSTVYDRTNGLRNQCVDCHADQNMALHKDKVFMRGDYVEPLTCESCHMPFAALAGAPSPASVVGPYGHIGDTRSHIFRLSGEQVDYTAFLTDDKTKVRLDSEGRAAITADMVCLRCHNPQSLPTLAFTPERAGEIAAKVHFPSIINEKYIRELLNRP